MNKKCKNTECKNLLSGRQTKWCSDNCYTVVWQKKNRKHYLDQKKTYHNINKAKILEGKKQHHIKNQDRILKSKREHYQSNKEYHYEKAANRRALKTKSGTHTIQDIRDKLDFYDSKCFYCGCKLDNYHIDHMIPLSRGGSNSWENLAISCPSCNLRKGIKTAEEFTQLT